MFILKEMSIWLEAIKFETAYQLELFKERQYAKAPR